MAPKFDAIPLLEPYLPSEEAYSSSFFKPKRPRQLRRRVALPTGSASAEAGLVTALFSVAAAGAATGADAGAGAGADLRSAGGFGADRPLLVPLVVVEFVPPTRRRVGVRRILESAALSVAVSSLAGAIFGAAGFRAAGLRVRVAAGRRVLDSAAEVDDVDRRGLDRRAVAALVAALSSPLGDAASSDTSGRDEATDRDRA